MFCFGTLLGALIQLRLRNHCIVLFSQLSNRRTFPLLSPPRRVRQRPCSNRRNTFDLFNAASFRDIRFHNLICDRQWLFFVRNQKILQAFVVTEEERHLFSVRLNYDCMNVVTYFKTLESTRDRLRSLDLVWRSSALCKRLRRCEENKSKYYYGQ